MTFMTDRRRNRFAEYLRITATPCNFSRPVRQASGFVVSWGMCFPILFGGTSGDPDDLKMLSWRPYPNFSGYSTQNRGESQREN